MTSASKTGTTQGWTYDANGNRLTQTGTVAGTYTPASTSNRLSSITGTPARTYTYSASGSTLTYSTTTFTYYNSGRMKTAKVGSSTTTYVYNALGQRIKKSGGPAGTVLTVYDEAGHLVGEYNSTGGLVQETVWLGDTPVATLRPHTGGGIDIYYVHADHLNAPRMVTRPSDNKIAWRWDTDPFGTFAPNQNPQSLGTFVYNLRYPGQYFDSETGVFYNVFRDYDPQTGRYVESDPIGLDGGINTYTYAGSNPSSRVDPLGLVSPIEEWRYAQALEAAIPPPAVSAELKNALCKDIKACNGDMNCLYKKLNADRRNPLWPGGPADSKTWNDSLLRQTENFATAAASNSVAYPASWGAHNAAGIWVYQYVWKPHVMPAMNWRTTPVSDDAYNAGLAGAYFYNRPPADALKWCNQCDSK